MAIKGVVKPSHRVGFVLHAALLCDFAHAGGVKHVPLEVLSGICRASNFLQPSGF